jgi:hypothetical protein
LNFFPKTKKNLGVGGWVSECLFYTLHTTAVKKLKQVAQAVTVSNPAVLL